MTRVPIRTSDPSLGETVEMCSYAMDVWLDDVAILTDESALLRTMREAAEAGGASVLGHTSATCPDGTVTAVLLLAQSHLSVHTWPNRALANFDLLTCGQLHGERILEHLREVLRPARSNVVRTIRDVS